MATTLKSLGLFLLSRPHYFTRAILLYRVVQYVGADPAYTHMMQARCAPLTDRPRP
jgi:hypothetical protein